MTIPLMTVKGIRDPKVSFDIIQPHIRINQMNPYKQIEFPSLWILRLSFQDKKEVLNSKFSMENSEFYLWDKLY